MTDQINTSREAIVEMLDNVPPGPWRASFEEGAIAGEYCVTFGDQTETYYVASIPWLDTLKPGTSASTADFIAASRDLVPAILARAQAAEAEMARQGTGDLPQPGKSAPNLVR
jgi:hypothetical protein